MNLTISLDAKLIKELRKLAVDRDTTLTGLVREYLEKLALKTWRPAEGGASVKPWNVPSGSSS